MGGEIGKLIGTIDIEEVHRQQFDINRVIPGLNFNSGGLKIFYAP